MHHILIVFGNGSAPVSVRERATVFTCNVQKGMTKSDSTWFQSRKHSKKPRHWLWSIGVKQWFVTKTIFFWAFWWWVGMLDQVSSWSRVTAWQQFNVEAYRKGFHDWFQSWWWRVGFCLRQNKVLVPGILVSLAYFFVPHVIRYSYIS
jgi:hypothetical protein